MLKMAAEESNGTVDVILNFTLSVQKLLAEAVEDENQPDEMDMLVDV
jgi:hypothetical protein